MLYHTGARNFECKICGNKFFQMEHLKRHMQSIHNINDATGSTVTSLNMPQPQKCKKSTSKSLKQDQKDDLAQTGNSDGNLVLNDSNISNHPNIYQTSEPSAQATCQESVQECYKITSKCMYKCQKCEFSTNKLFTLNDHVISKHIESVACNNNEIASTTELNGREENPEVEESLLENEAENYEDDDNDYNDEDECKDEIDINGNEANGSFSCAFCLFKATRKNILKVKFIF